MVDSKDLLKVGGVVAGVAALAAVGFVAGYVVARDPKALRRWARAAAGNLERIQIALAETREELADLWAEARAHARADIEEAAMASAEAAAAAQAARAAPPAQSQGESEVAGAAPAPSVAHARTPRRARGAPSRSHH